MNKYKMIKAGINVNEAVKRFGNSQEIYERFLRKFPDELCYDKLKKALEVKETEAAFQAAHALKGIAGNLSLKELYKASYLLTEELRAGSMEHSDELIKAVDEAYKRVISVIE
ncbi:MAG: Hpt domain-containing protein [Clostridium sp.]|nr:Hpt domain-containing protein [Clostridium sp.]